MTPNFVKPFPRQRRYIRHKIVDFPLSPLAAALDFAPQNRNPHFSPFLGIFLLLVHSFTVFPLRCTHPILRRKTKKVAPCRATFSKKSKNPKKGVAFSFEMRYNTSCAIKAHESRGVEQLVARRAHNPKVVGSSPAPATISSGCNGFQLHPLFY